MVTLFSLFSKGKHVCFKRLENGEGLGISVFVTVHSQDLGPWDAAVRERGRALSCLPVPGPRAQPVHTWSCGVPRVPHSFSGAWEACSSGKNYIFIANLETTTVLKSIYSKVLFKFPSQTSEYFSASILAFGQLQVLTTLLSQQLRSFKKRIS